MERLIGRRLFRWRCKRANNAPVDIAPSIDGRSNSPALNPSFSKRIGHRVPKNLVVTRRSSVRNINPRRGTRCVTRRTEVNSNKYGHYPVKCAIARYETESRKKERA